MPAKTEEKDMETNEIFCKIFQKDITEEGYIYFPGRDEALEQCTFEFQARRIRLFLNLIRKRLVAP